MNSVITGTIFRNLREKAQLSVQDVSTLLHKKHCITMSPRTLLSYETGCCISDITHFLALCNIYNCQDILYTFGYSDKKASLSNLSSEEQQIINNYRNLPILEKNIILGALGIKKERFLQRIALLNDREILSGLILRRCNTLGHCVLKKKRLHYQCSKTFYLPTLY